jgi:hypothetical protein
MITVEYGSGRLAQLVMRVKKFLDAIYETYFILNIQCLNATRS